MLKCFFAKKICLTKYMTGLNACGNIHIISSEVVVLFPKIILEHQ